MKTMPVLNDLVPPGYWGVDLSNIHIVEDFLTEEEQKQYADYIENITNWNGVQHYAWSNRIHNAVAFTGDRIQPLMKTVFDRMKTIIEETLPIKVTPNNPSIARWRPGDGQAPHADKQETDGRPNCCPDYDISSIVYLNDEYEGGEIYFPNQEFKVKPPKKTLIFFPGDVHFLHGVTTVTSGHRYTIPVFWKVRQVLRKKLTTSRGNYGLRPKFI